MDNQNLNSFNRVDESHPLDLYIGTNELSRPTLFLITKIEPTPVSSSQMINISIGKRQDGQWGISFTLTDNKFDDLFGSFCKDIIESSRSIKNKNDGANYICNRYELWQQMMTKYNGELLSKPAIKGLIGELYFLKDYLFPIYGQKEALNSWIGPDKADQDFVLENLWYEVKSTVSGGNAITIASVEQLDMSTRGELVIIYLDKTSSIDKSCINLNSIFKEINDSLEDENLKKKFSAILLNHNYFPRPEYNEPSFKLSAIERYIVDSKFPCIRRQNLPESVINTSYQLSIVSLKDKLIEK